MDNLRHDPVRADRARELFARFYDMMKSNPGKAPSTEDVGNGLFAMALFLAFCCSREETLTKAMDKLRESYPILEETLRHTYGLFRDSYPRKD